MNGRADAAADRPSAAPRRTQSDVHTRGDVIDIADRLSHLGQRLFQLLVCGVQKLFNGSKRSAYPDQDRRQGQRDEQGGGPEGEPHEALGRHSLNTRWIRPANT
jgi:hypothetical protein